MKCERGLYLVRWKELAEETMTLRRLYILYYAEHSLAIQTWFHREKDQSQGDFPLFSRYNQTLHMFSLSWTGGQITLQTGESQTDRFGFHCTGLYDSPSSTQAMSPEPKLMVNLRVRSTTPTENRIMFMESSTTSTFSLYTLAQSGSDNHSLAIFSTWDAMVRMILVLFLDRGN